MLDETATLLKARGESPLVEPLFERVFESASCLIQWMDAEQFAAVRAYYKKHADQSWSFTDCLSFCVMKERKIREALTADLHFEQAGYSAMLR